MSSVDGNESDGSTTAISNANIIAVPKGRRYSRRVRKKASNIYEDKYWGKEVFQKAKARILSGVDMDELQSSSKEFFRGLQEKRARSKSKAFSKMVVKVRSVSDHGEDMWRWTAVGNNAELCEKGMHASYRKHTFQLHDVQSVMMASDTVRVETFVTLRTDVPECVRNNPSMKTVNLVLEGGGSKRMSVRSVEVKEGDGGEEYALWVVDGKGAALCAEGMSIRRGKSEPLLIQEVGQVEEEVEEEMEEVVHIFTPRLDKGLDLSTVKSMSLHMEDEDCEADLVESDDEEDDDADFLVRDAKVVGFQKLKRNTQWRWRVATDDAEMFMKDDVVVIKDNEDLAAMTLSVLSVTDVLGHPEFRDVQTETDNDHLALVQKLVRSKKTFFLQRQPRHQGAVKIEEVDDDDDDDIEGDEPVGDHTSDSDADSLDAGARDNHEDPDFVAVTSDDDTDDSESDSPPPVVHKRHKKKSRDRSRKRKRKHKKKHKKKRRRRHHHHHKRRKRSRRDSSSDSSRHNSEPRRPVKKARTKGKHEQTAEQAFPHTKATSQVQMLLEEMQESKEEMRICRSQEQKRNAQLELNTMAQELRDMESNCALWRTLMEKRVVHATRAGSHEEVKTSQELLECLQAVLK